MSSKKNIPKKVKASTKKQSCQWMSKLDPHDIPDCSYGTTLTQTSIANFVSPSNKVKRKIVNPMKKKQDIIDLCQSESIGMFTKKKDDVEVIDITDDRSAAIKSGQLLPGTPISLIRSNYSLYFSYDPRGLKVTPLKIGYCMYCKCPSNYCAEKVFGHICYKRCETKIYSKGCHRFDDEAIEDMYRKVYTKMLFAKMSFNNISYTTTHLYRIPKCMKLNSYSRLLARVKRDNKKSDKLLWDDDFDMSKEELNAFAKRHCPDYKHTYDYSIDFSKQEDEEEKKYMKELEEDAKTVKRSAVEQVADVSPLFKVAKQEVKKEKRK